MVDWKSMKKALISSILAVLATLATQAAQAHPCVEDRFEGTNYVVCTVDPIASELALFWKNAQDQPHRTFSNVANTLREQGKDLIFAFNAGMYQSDFSPLGLYVENGEQLRPADTLTIEAPPREVPNFYKEPNGVFSLGETGASILPTDVFLAAQPDIRFATQSGPMLVIENALHPALIPGSSDRTRRSGVGVCEGGLVRFAISDDRVNFHDFARLFKDHLSCADALFLDGGRGAGVYIPQMRRNDFSWHGGFGPMVGLVE